MTNTNNLPMTVADLIAALQTFDPNLPVEMAMNNEYQCEVQHGDVRLVTDTNFTYVLIGE